MIGWIVMNKIENYLNELYPNPKCELNYNKDYELLMAVMLSAQTTDKKVNEVTKILFKKYDSLEKLNKAKEIDLINIIKPIGNQNKKDKYIKNIAFYVLNNGIPNDRNSLTKIVGIGRKTANLVLGILYNENYMPVDTHVRRVSIRLGLVEDFDNNLIIENKLEKIFDNCFDAHLKLVLFGRYHCKAIKPLCLNCKLKSICKKVRF